MKKLLGLFVLAMAGLGSCSIANAWDQKPPQALQACQAQAPWGFPKTAKQGPGICRHAYVSQNDTTAKLPIWVSYTLLPQNALGCIPRSNAFAPDASLPKGQRAELKDYAGTGYDIGHTAPDGDMSFDQQAEYESFLLTNMTPQLPGLNRGIWKLLETAVRGWAVQRNHAMVVYAGPIYNASDKTIGDSKVVVPHAFYKIVTDSTTGEVAGFIFPHAGNQGNDLTKVRASIDQIEKATGVAFSFPANAKELPANQLWAVDYGALTKAKKAKCGASAE